MLQSIEIVFTSARSRRHSDLAFSENLEFSFDLDWVSK